MILTAISWAAHIPTTKGSTGRMGIPRSRSCSMVELLDAIRAGNTTETMQIKTITTENKNTAQLEKSIFLLICFISDELVSSNLGSSFSFLNVFPNWLCQIQLWYKSLCY